MKRIIRLFVTLCLLLALTACGQTNTMEESQTELEQEREIVEKTGGETVRKAERDAPPSYKSSYKKDAIEWQAKIEAEDARKRELPLVWGANVTWIMDMDEYDPVLRQEDYTPEHLHSYNFYDATTFVGCEEETAALIEAGKNPGLGVRSLHEQGITGESVRVAIIDQNMIQGHPELGDRLVAYKDFGTETPDDFGSMHGLSVASLLAGETVGTAPGALLYYGAVPSWKGDAQYYADALWWILEQNEALPEGDKIRVLSVSAAPQAAGGYISGEAWEEAVAAAQEQGILVIDCRIRGKETGFVRSSYYAPDDPENVEASKAGYPTEPGKPGEPFTDKGTLLAPASYRTIPAERRAGQRHWRYDGIGGQSWAVPYVAGVAAMGFQVYPELTAKQCKDLLFETAWNQFLNPAAFVDGVKALAQGE